MFLPTSLPVAQGTLINSDNESHSSHYTISSHIGREEAISLVKAIMRSRDILKEKNRTIQRQKEAIQNHDFQLEQILRHCIGRQAVRLEELEYTVQKYKTRAEKGKMLLEKGSRRRSREQRDLAAYRHQVYRLLRLILSFLETNCQPSDTTRKRCDENDGNDVCISSSSVAGEVNCKEEDTTSSTTTTTPNNNNPVTSAAVNNNNNNNNEFASSIITSASVRSLPAIPPPRLRLRSCQRLSLLECNSGSAGASDGIAVMVVCTPHYQEQSQQHHQRIQSAPLVYYDLASYANRVDVIPLKNPQVNARCIYPVVWPAIAELQKKT